MISGVLGSSPRAVANSVLAPRANDRTRCGVGIEWPEGAGNGTPLRPTFRIAGVDSVEVGLIVLLVGLSVSAGVIIALLMER